MVGAAGFGCLTDLNGIDTRGDMGEHRAVAIGFKSIDRCKNRS
jgi:hypothetical protein